MKRIVFTLSILLALFHPTYSYSLREIPAHHSEIVQQESYFFSDDSKNEALNIYVCLLSEDDEDAGSSEKGKKISAKVPFSTISFTVYHCKDHFYKTIWSKDHLPSINFLSLRVLRL
jgi:hypothetical protein